MGSFEGGARGGDARDARGGDERIRLKGDLCGDLRVKGPLFRL